VVITVYLVQDEFGYRGGSYYFLQRNEVLEHISQVSFEKVLLEKTGRGKRVGYGLRCEEDDKILKFEFSSNPNNRYFFLKLNLAKDFPRNRPYSKDLSDWGWPGPKEREIFCDEHEIASKYLNKFKLPWEMTTKVREFKRAREAVKDFVLSFSGGPLFAGAGASMEQALASPEVFLISVFAEQEGGLKAISNIIKYLKQVYVVKAFTDGLKGKVVKGEIGRGGRFSPKERVGKFSYEVWDHLQLCFGEPNFLIEASESFYSIWLEFSFTRHCRPDFLILKGKHDTPFEEGVYQYLSTQGEDFEKKVLGPWRKGFGLSFGIERERKSFSQIELLDFLRGLSPFLKKGAVVESKEGSFKIDEVGQQLRTYSKVFAKQSLFLLSWTSIPLEIKNEFRDFEMIGNFNFEGSVEILSSLILQRI